MALDGALEPDLQSDPLMPAVGRKPDRDGLQTALGYRFRDLTLLDRALTPGAAGLGPSQNNQRLEFLGDRVLGLAAAEMLHAIFPEATEGELSHRLSGLVRRETCAAMGAAWDLGPHLLGGGGGRASSRNRAILADAAEAVIGAVFLDGGYAAALALVERSLSERLRAPERPPHDPKSALNEWALGKALGEPAYAVLERSGPDHAPRFRVAARVPGLAEAFGTGRSKRAAEQDAAHALLIREGVWTAGEDAA